MIQQSHQHLADESSPLLKYLPLTSLLLTGSSTSQQPTIFFTPQNYMLVLSYCTSLEKEIQGLKNQLKKTQNANAQLWNKIHNLETLLRQPKNGKNVEATPKFGSATSFAMINNSRIQRMNVSRNQQREFDCGDSFFDREIINLLKEENQSLKKKIQKLYKQNLKITENYQKYLKLTLKDARSLHFKEASDQQSLFQKVEIMDTFSNCQIQPFSNQNSFFYSHNTRTSVVEPVINGILSEPNSCEISFQALPSFKSMDDMSSKHIRFDSTKFF